jgi:hypothetical protein
MSATVAAYATGRTDGGRATPRCGRFSQLVSIQGSPTPRRGLLGAAALLDGMGLRSTAREKRARARFERDVAAIERELARLRRDWIAKHTG